MHHCYIHPNPQLENGIAIQKLLCTWRAGSNVDQPAGLQEGQDVTGLVHNSPRGCFGSCQLLLQLQVRAHMLLLIHMHCNPVSLHNTHMHTQSAHNACAVIIGQSCIEAQTDINTYLVQKIRQHQTHRPCAGL